MPSAAVSIGSGSASDRTPMLAPGQVMHEVEDLTQVAADPVEGVDDDGVAGPGIGQELAEAAAVEGGAGFLVGMPARKRPTPRAP